MLIKFENLLINPDKVGMVQVVKGQDGVFAKISYRMLIEGKVVETETKELPIEDVNNYLQSNIQLLEEQGVLKK